MNSEEKGIRGEEFVNEIAYKSFLKYWCYPGPEDEKGSRKEVCDLLIIFGDTIIIFSVKNYEFKENHPRYFRNTIDKAIKQIYGAERKLLNQNKDLFIKHPDRELERFPKAEIKKVHRLIVNLGEGVKFYPFSSKTKNEKFITILDKDAFKTITEELDTIPDFIEYLEKREALFFDKEVLILPGEENDWNPETGKQFLEHSLEAKKTVKNILFSGTEHDLLASYLENNRTFPTSISTEDYTDMYLQLDGNWNDFTSSEMYKAKKTHDKQSYFIDELVLNELIPNQQIGSDEIAKLFLSLDRLNRRVLGKSFFEFYEKNKHIKGNHWARRYQKINETSFLLVAFSPEMPQDLLPQLAQVAMDCFCYYKNYECKNMVLIAFTPGIINFRFTYLSNIEPFSKEEEEKVKHNIEILGWFKNQDEYLYSEDEFPEK